jgi:hypothetical protein
MNAKNLNSHVVEPAALHWEVQLKVLSDGGNNHSRCTTTWYTSPANMIDLATLASAWCTTSRTYEQTTTYKYIFLHIDLFSYAGVVN